MRIKQKKTKILQGRDKIMGYIINSDGSVTRGNSPSNITYPLTIQVNKKVYTGFQVWTIKSITLLENKTIVSITIQSLDQNTTAWSGSGIIRTNEGKEIRQLNTNLPKNEDNSFIIKKWDTFNVTETYNAIPSDTKGFSLFNDTVIVKGITINNGKVSVPEFNREEFIGTTRADYNAKCNARWEHREKTYKREFGIV